MFPHFCGIKLDSLWTYSINETCAKSNRKHPMVASIFLLLDSNNSYARETFNVNQVYHLLLYFKDIVKHRCLHAQLHCHCQLYLHKSSVDFLYVEFK